MKERYVRDTDLEPHGCEWPKCKCPVPDYALSMHNRVHYCKKLTEAIENGRLKARQSPIDSPSQFHGGEGHSIGG